jgi:deoxyadenosine/deoxycytidine kinase
MSSSTAPTAPNVIILSLDGNIGSGKTTLLHHIRNHFHDLHVVDEPVGQWTTMFDKDGKSLLELFYEDKKRWSYTFQTCALRMRLRNIQEAVAALDPTVKGPHVILTERSMLTDKNVFAEMLYDAGDMNQIEWDLYQEWFNTFGRSYPIHGIIYLSTSSATSKERIGIRNRQGEDRIGVEYLDALDAQHKKWIQGTNLPVLTLSTEPDQSVQDLLSQIHSFIQERRTA